MWNKKKKEIELLKQYNQLISNDIKEIVMILHNNHLFLDTEYHMETDFSVHRKVVTEIRTYLEEESERGKGEAVRKQLDILRGK